MSRDNVKKVLVTSGNQAPITVDSLPDDLALGQAGVFDTSTNKAIDGTTAVKDFYVAVGVDNGGTGSVNDVEFSAGQLIQTNNLRGYTFRPHTASRPHIVKLAGFIADDEVYDYAIKLEFRNQKIARLQGVNQFTQTYVIKNKKYDSVTLAQEIVDTVNANEMGFIEAYLTVRQALTVADGYSKEYAVGDTITDEDDITKLKATVDVYVDIDFVTKPIDPNKALNVNIRFYNFRQTLVIPSIIEGFGFDTTFNTTQVISQEEGDGNQLRQFEYHENKASPYIASDVNPIPRQLDYNAVAGTKYDQLILEYDQFSVAGWLEHLNNLQTTIGFPVGEGLARNGLITILDAQFTSRGFHGLADDSAAAITDKTVVEKTKTKSESEDGLQ